MLRPGLVGFLQKGALASVSQSQCAEAAAELQKKRRHPLTISPSEDTDLDDEETSSFIQNVAVSQLNGVCQ